MSARRDSITIASPGRPLSAIARASITISSGLFALPFCTARHARSWNCSKSPAASAISAWARQASTVAQSGAGDWDGTDTENSQASVTNSNIRAENRLGAPGGWRSDESGGGRNGENEEKV